MAWSDNRNYCDKCNTLCQPCSSLWLIIVLLFKFGWLNLLQDPTFNQTGSLFMALQFVFILSCPHSTNIQFRLKLCSPYLFFYLSTLIWTLSGMWNALIAKYCLLFTFLFPDCKDSKGKETPSELDGTYLWVDRFFGSTQKMVSRG